MRLSIKQIREFRSTLQEVQFQSTNQSTEEWVSLQCIFQVHQRHTLSYLIQRNTGSGIYTVMFRFKHVLNNSRCMRSGIIMSERKGILNSCNVRYDIISENLVYMWSVKHPSTWSVKILFRILCRPYVHIC